MFKGKKFDFIGQKKKIAIITAVIFGLGILFTIINGVTLDIKFTGGSMFKYSYREASASDLSASDLSASDISASDISASDAESEVAGAVDVVTPDTISAGDISASDVSSSNIPVPVVDDTVYPEISELGITPRNGTEIDTDEVKKIMKKLLGADVTTSLSSTLALDASTKTALTIKLNEKRAINNEGGAKIITALNTMYPDLVFEAQSINSVDPIMGKEFFWKCMVAIILATVFMIIYVAFRFRKIGGWSAGLMAVVAVLHDCAMVFFAFVIFKFPINDNFVAVILSIIGYTLNSTIVIYDRVREDRRVLGPKVPVRDLMNLSINETFGRTINTNLTFLFTVGAVAVVAAIYGVTSIISFAVPMLFGAVSGCYSSLFIANILWVTVQEKKAAGIAAKTGTKKK